MYFFQDGFTPIDVAVQQGHEKVVAALLHHDSRVSHLAVLCSFPLLLATPYLEVITLLCQQKNLHREPFMFTRGDAV